MQGQLSPHEIKAVEAGKAHIWMNRLVTLSIEWKTSEFRHVIIADASGPMGSVSSTRQLLAYMRFKGLPIVRRYAQMNKAVDCGKIQIHTRSSTFTK